jgi:hypothetical protein
MDVCEGIGIELKAGDVVKCSLVELIMMMSRRCTRFDVRLVVNGWTLHKS